MNNFLNKKRIVTASLLEETAEQSKKKDPLIEDIMSELNEMKRNKGLILEEETSDEYKKNYSQYFSHRRKEIVFIREIRELLIEEMLQIAKQFENANTEIKILNGYNCAVLMYNQLSKKKRKTQKTEMLLKELLKLKQFAYEQLTEYIEQLKGKDNH